MTSEDSAVCRTFATLQALALAVPHLFFFLIIISGRRGTEWLGVLAIGPLIAIDVLCCWLIALDLIRRAIGSASGVDVTIVGSTVATTAAVLVVLKALIFLTPAYELYETLIRRVDPRWRDLLDDQTVLASFGYALMLFLVWPVAAGISFVVWRRLARKPAHGKNRAV